MSWCNLRGTSVNIFSFEHAIDILGCFIHDGNSCLDIPNPCSLDSE